MRWILLVLMIVVATTTQAQFRHENTGAYQCAAGKINRGNLQKTTTVPLPHPANALKYKLKANFFHCFLPPYPDSFEAALDASFLVLTPTDSLVLNAANASLTIQDVGGDANSFSHINNVLTIYLNQLFLPGDTIHLYVKYQHNDLVDNAFYANNGYVFTDCEPEGARRWFPCYDSPDDKAQFELIAGTPATVKLGSNGILADSVMVADTLFYHWISTDKVATYLMVVSAYSNYSLDIRYWLRTSNPSDSVELRYYYQPGENPEAVEEIIHEAIAYFSEIFCDHPFSKNGFATVGPQFSWGGMENQTLTSLHPNNWSEYLAVHEFAHQWFGDMITCKSWADIWLNEGFATYSESLWAEHAYGYEAYREDVENNANYYLNSNPGWAISNPDWAVNTPSSSVLFNYPITYAKGASVHHLLRYTLGDSLYFESLRQYAQNPGLQYESAEIADFVDAVNSATGDDYTWFFDQWIFEPNHPVYNNIYWIEQLPDERWRITFTVHQVQDTPPFFKMPIELRVIGQNNLDTTLRMMNDQNHQSFVFESEEKITNLFFDFNNEIVLKEGSTLVGIRPDEGSQPGFDIVPVRNQKTLRVNILTAGTRQQCKLTLSDLTGRTVKDFSQQIHGEGEYNLNSGDLKTGIYLATLVANGHAITKKIIIL